MVESEGPDLRPRKIAGGGGTDQSSEPDFSAARRCATERNTGRPTGDGRPIERTGYASAVFGYHLGPWDLLYPIEHYCCAVSCQEKTASTSGVCGNTLLNFIFVKYHYNFVACLPEHSALSKTESFTFQ
jgi:hypothetical protein